MIDAMKEQTVRDKIEQFFASGATKFYRRGETIVFAGEEPAGVMLLSDGLIEQYDITSRGDKLTVNMFRPGVFFPMSWAITKTPNKYFFSAFSDVTVSVVEANAAVRFLHDNSDVTFDLLRRVYIGTDAILSRLVLAASGVAAERLVFELLIEAHRFGQMTDSSHALIKVKQTCLAERSGLARETVGRELHDLADDGLITVTRQGIMLSLDKLSSRLGVAV